MHPQRTLLRAVLLIGVSLASFLLSAAGIRELLGPADGDEAASKLSYLEGHIGEYDTFFVGSSVIFRHVVPAVFDARRAELGKPTHSFNLGSQGMGALEADRVLSELIELLPDDSHATIYLDAMEPVAELFAGQKTTERIISWHDLEHTRVALELIPIRTIGKGKAAKLAIDHLRACAWRLTNYAQAPRILRRVLPQVFPARQGSLDEASIAEGAGYQALEVSQDPFVIRRGKEFAASDGSALKASVRALRAALTMPKKRIEGDDVRKQFVLRRVADAEAKGARLVWLITPTLMPRTSARNAGPFAPPAFIYNDPTRYPEYFSRASHFDRNHLSRASAESFSRRLAEDTARGKQKP